MMELEFIHLSNCKYDHCHVWWVDVYIWPILLLLQFSGCLIDYYAFFIHHVVDVGYRYPNQFLFFHSICIKKAISQYFSKLSAYFSIGKVKEVKRTKLLI